MRAQVLPSTFILPTKFVPGLWSPFPLIKASETMKLVGHRGEFRLVTSGRFGRHVLVQLVLPCRSSLWNSDQVRLALWYPSRWRGGRRVGATSQKCEAVPRRARV